HHASIAAESVDAIVEHLEVRPVEVGSLPFPRDRHADAAGHSLSEWPRRCFYSRGPAIFRMPRTLAVELAKTLDVINRDAGFAHLFVVGIHRLHSGKVQDGIQQHRRVSDGKHETIAIWPDAIFGIEAQDAIPQRI